MKRRWLHSSGAPTASQDFLNRISGSGVVWYHPFQSQNEVNAFRWTPGYGSGNDPLAVGDPNAQYTHYLSTDGPAAGFGCLEFVRQAGTDDGSHWWRPMSPIQGGTTTGNGRGAGQDDPGAAGTITAQAYTATDGGGQVAGWTKGVYCNSTYASTVGANYDSNEYWFQCRVKIDPQRCAGTPNTNVDQGKLIYQSLTNQSNVNQEIVNVSWHGTTNHDYFSSYMNGGASWVFQGGATLGAGGGPTWEWPLGQWATVLWHCKPGTMTGALGSNTPNSDTVYEVFAAKPGETSYTQVCSIPNLALPFQTQWGHNALILSIYQNASNMTQFYHRFGQLIFSKQSIPCPQV